MIKNILGKKDPKQEPIKDEEIQKLRDKFNNIVKTENPGSGDSAKSAQAGNSSNPQANAPTQPQGTAANFQYVDPQRAEDNERITNLIMQQIKELIEIDNNLNSKNKELEVKISDNASSLNQTKSIVEQFNSRLELIEKNMEKFMGLYEVVTNRFNPFVSQEVEPDIDASSATSQTSKGVAVVEDAIADSTMNLDEDVREIISGAGIRDKLVTEQQEIIKDELAQALEKAGPPAEAPDVKKELAGQVSLVVAEELKKAMAHHIRLSNDDLKKAMKEMLLETISHIRTMSKTEQVRQAKEVQQPAKETTQPAKEMTRPDSGSEEVHPDYHFYLSDGTAIKSVAGLKSALEKMDDRVFSEHVTDDRNDFADWIRVVLKNDQVADRIAQEKTKGGIRTVLDTIR